MNAEPQCLLHLRVNYEILIPIDFWLPQAAIPEPGAPPQPAGEQLPGRQRAAAAPGLLLLRVPRPRPLRGGARPTRAALNTSAVTGNLPARINRSIGALTHYMMHDLFHDPIKVRGIDIRGTALLLPALSVKETCALL